MVKILTWNKPREPTDVELNSLMKDGIKPTHCLMEQNFDTGVLELPNTEIRVVAEGKIECCVAGRRHCLKKGDKIELPAKQPFIMRNVHPGQSVVLCAKKAKTVYIELY